ncbi:hypothetical protein [Micromonospora sp. NBRC 107095]|uniref:hypothetical protein n=1 Tax=Micromonospora sp. NBRC 107095 TaxID=3032209 RepID=UPI0024A3B835|nr:hypothetical protein [Micromonospora sp. NBRC 107095]GLZ57774.1 hypothetical protein Misp05_13500 [Micromonospora sp. NBRC 107095]
MRAWTLPDVEIVLDHVVDAGGFVEFDFKGDAEDVSDAIQRLDAFIVALGIELGEQVNKGYPHMLLGRDR